jgi:hypothetical protein
MKKIISHCSILLLTATVFHACNYDTLQLFEKKPDVYFYITKNNPDSTFIKFAYLPGGQTETIDSILVRVSGRLANHDRQFSVKVDPTSTAIQGVHYEILSTIVPVEKATGHIILRITRDASLSAEEVENVVLKLSLQPNEEFGTDIKTTKVDNKEISTISYKVYITDKLVKPLRWMDIWFGNYSKAKFLLICGVNNFPPAFLDGEPIDGMTWTTGDYANTAQLTQNYLNNQDPPIYDDENNEFMRMGPNVN